MPMHVFSLLSQSLRNPGADGRQLAHTFFSLDEFERFQPELKKHSEVWSVCRNIWVGWGLEAERKRIPGWKDEIRNGGMVCGRHHFIILLPIACLLKNLALSYPSP